MARAQNCIGRRNYGLFLLTIALTCLLLTAQIAASVAALAAVASDDAERGWPAALARLQRRLGPHALSSRGPYIALLGATPRRPALRARTLARPRCADRCALRACPPCPFRCPCPFRRVMSLPPHALAGAAVLLALSLPTWLLIGQLCAFHASLRSDGITT